MLNTSENPSNGLDASRNIVKFDQQILDVSLLALEKVLIFFPLENQVNLRWKLHT